jgi:GAF domain-containing protein
VLRNVALFDREDPGARVGPDAPLLETYCSIVGATGATFATDDTRHDPRTAAHPARDAVVSYCGALVRAPDGRAVGTLCSFDVQARPVPSHEIPLLEAVAPLLAPAVLAHGQTPSAERPLAARPAQGHAAARPAPDGPAAEPAGS